MAFLSAAAEWSGYMLTFGLYLWSALAAWSCYRRGLTARSHLLDAIAVGLGTATALGVMLVYYEWAIGVDVWLDRILIRSAERSLGTLTNTTPLDLLHHLRLSANGWLIGTAILAVLAGFARVRLRLSWPVVGALFGLGMALLENAVMGEAQGL